MTTADDLDWTGLLLDQVEWHWTHHLRPRLDGLTDEEYLWEPVAGCWSVRPRGSGTTSLQVGVGDHVIEFEPGEPSPAPVTTLAWRLGHVIVGVLAERNAGHFGAPPASYQTWEYAGTAAGALQQLDEEWATWRAGVRELGPEGLAAPCGPSEGPWADHPRAELVLHINRELLHHGAEMCLLRDLWAHRA